MKISILLPYKENYSPEYPGAVSIFIKDTLKYSEYNKKIKIYGNTELNKRFSDNYVNLNFKKSFLKSSTKSYVSEFLKHETENRSDIIEFHNRPSYLKYLYKLTYVKKVLYFHNDPLNMQGSKTINERINLINNLEKIVFNSNWSKSRFTINLPNIYKNSAKLITIKQSIDPKKINLKNKKNYIIFVGKLNSAKGYDIFGKSVLPVLNKYKNWKALVIGDEPRENIIFEHPRLKLLGFKKHNEVLKYLEKSSIAVACSRWDEPFGRSSLEAASRGCAVIVSNKGGLKETVTNGIILKDLNIKKLSKIIEKLIINRKQRIKYQNNSIKNFYLTNNYASKKIDNYRSVILKANTDKIKLNNLKILHVTNFNERFNGRMFYNTGRRINNGLIKLNHKVLNLSDRDILRNSRSFLDFNGSKSLNKIFLKTVDNFKPHLIIFGHADSIKKESIIKIKKNYPNIKMSQWFLDRMDSKWKINKNRFLDKIKFLDYSFCTTDPRSLNLYNNKISYIPNPVDESIDDLKVYENKKPEYDLFFAMSHGVHRGVLKKGKYDEREKLIYYLMKKNPHLKFNIFGMNKIQPIWGDDFKKNLYNSKIALNLSQGKALKYYSSDRIAQLIGNGIATLIDRKTKLSKFFSDKEVIFYNSKIDLHNKLNKILKDDIERNRLAKKGKDLYHKKYNSKKVAEYIIYKTFGINKKFNW